VLIILDRPPEPFAFNRATLLALTDLLRQAWFEQNAVQHHRQDDVLSSLAVTVVARAIPEN
jgi:hypothetical protein